MVIVAATLVLVVTACGGPDKPDRAATHSPLPVPTGARSPSAARSSHSSPSSPSTASRPHPGRVVVTVLPWRLPQRVGREAAVATPAGVVVVGGLVAGDQSSASTYHLDLRSGRSRRLPDLPVAVHDVGAALVRGSPLVIGGGNTAEQDVVQTRGPGGGWRVVGRLPSARSDLVSVSAGGRVFVIGGYDGTSPALADILVSTTGRRFTVFARLAVPVRYPAAAVADGAIWVFGGERSGVMVDAVQRIDLSTGQVRVVGNLPHPLGHATAVRLAGRILLVGGRASENALTGAMWWFDPTNGFHFAGRLPTPLADSAVLRSGRSTYLIGGETPQLSDRVLQLTLR